MKRRRPYNPEDNGGPPNRELDSERTGTRAGTPVGLIRRPVKQLPMKPVKR